MRRRFRLAPLNDAAAMKSASAEKFVVSTTSVSPSLLFVAQILLAGQLARSLERGDGRVVPDPLQVGMPIASARCSPSWCGSRLLRHWR
jgi:hypothetical protein